MAGDWIKLRVWIARDPKVIAMTDYLAEQRPFMDWLCDPVRRSCKDTCYEHVTRNVTRCVTVVGLLQVWGIANDVGRPDGADLVLRRATLDGLDEIADIPCFGAALAHVGWALEEEDEHGNAQVRFPNFMTNNVPAEERVRFHAAERQRRYREKRRKPGTPEDQEEALRARCGVTLRVTSHSNGREEKSREENKESPPPPKRGATMPDIPSELSTPEFIEAWKEWLQFRSERKPKVAPTGARRLLAKLSRWGAARATAAILNSIANGWQGVYEETGRNGRPLEVPKQPTETRDERLARLAREREESRRQADPDAIREALGKVLRKPTEGADDGRGDAAGG